MFPPWPGIMDFTPDFDPQKVKEQNWSHIYTALAQQKEHAIVTVSKQIVVWNSSGLRSMGKTLANVSLKHMYFRLMLANVRLSWTCLCMVVEEGASMGDCIALWLCRGRYYTFCVLVIPALYDSTSIKGSKTWLCIKECWTKAPLIHIYSANLPCSLVYFKDIPSKGWSVYNPHTDAIAVNH